MRTRPTLALLLLCAACATPPPTFDTSTPAGKLSSMWWLAGSWVGTGEGKTWEAHYTLPAGDLLLGMSRRHSGENAVDFYEFEVFRVDGDRLVVQPFVNGTASAVFALKEFDPKARRAVFENPDHEPRTLDYWRIDEETLVIAVTTPIEGAAEGAPKVKGFRVVLKRG